MPSKFSRKMHRLNQWRHELRESIKHRPVLFFAYKTSIIAIGIFVIAAGIAMLVLPGPGLLAILAGFSILATEIPWARHLVRRVKLHGKRILASYKRWKKSRS